MPRPVFIYSSWRTASTWVWKQFRDCAGAHAYYEVYHRALLESDLATLATHGPSNWNTRSNHPESAPYFLEFAPLLRPGATGIASMTPAMTFANMLPAPGAPLPDDEAAYIGELLGLADRLGKTPVLTCTKNLGRAPATRRTFPDAVHIVTVRNLWHQWMSFCGQNAAGNEAFLLAVSRALHATAGHDPVSAFILARHGHALTPPPAGHTPSADLLYAFAGLHLHLYARAVSAADCVVDINRMAADAPYREATTARVRTLTGLPVDFSGASSRLEYGPTPTPSGEELRAHLEPVLALIFSNPELTRADAARTEVRRIADEFYAACESFDFHTRAVLRHRRDEAARQSKLEADLAHARAVAAARTEELELARLEIRRLNRLIYSTRADRHLFRAWKVLRNDPHYTRPEAP